MSASAAMLATLAFVPLAGSALAGIGARQRRIGPYLGGFALGAVFAAARANLLPAMTGAGPAFALLLGLALGCLTGMAVRAVAEFLWPVDLASVRGGRRMKTSRATQKRTKLLLNATLSTLLVAFSMGTAHAARAAAPEIAMIALALEVFWLASMISDPADGFATCVTEGILLSSVALLGQMVGMALAKGTDRTEPALSIALGFGAAMYVGVHALLAHPRRAIAPRALAVSLWAGYGGTLAFVPLV